MTIYLFAGRREYPAHPGVYRKRLVTTSLTPENILQYTHQSKAPPKMILFVGMMRVIGLPPFFIAPEEYSQKYLEEKDISPFAMAV